jgi:hypothetical protein
LNQTSYHQITAAKQAWWSCFSDSIEGQSLHLHYPLLPFSKRFYNTFESYTAPDLSGKALYIQSLSPEFCHSVVWNTHDNTATDSLSEHLFFLTKRSFRYNINGVTFFCTVPGGAQRRGGISPLSGCCRGSLRSAARGRNRYRGRPGVCLHTSQEPPPSTTRSQPVIP